MYKVLVFAASDFGSIERELNLAADEGYRPIHFWQTDSRLGVVMEYKRGPGRSTRKDIEASNLGE
jgi:hypothetical protein